MNSTNSTHLIIKSRTVATQLRKTNPDAAQKLIRLVERWETLRCAQCKLHFRGKIMSVDRGETHVA